MTWEFALLSFFHVVFMAWGLGGATVAAILMIKARKEPALMPSVMKFMEPVSKLIWIAIIGLLITGIVIAALGAGKGSYDAGVLAVKHAAVTVLVINGLILSLLLLPKLKKLFPAPGSKPSLEFLKTSKLLNASSTIGLVLWYVIAGLSIAL